MRALFAAKSAQGCGTNTEGNMPVMGWLLFGVGLLVGLMPAAYLAGAMFGVGGHREASTRH
jgi:hypothetical protein